MIDDQRIDDRVWFGLIEYIDDNIVKLIYVFPSPPLPSPPIVQDWFCFIWFAPGNFCMITERTAAQWE